MLDAQESGAGVSAEELDLYQLLEFLPMYNKTLELNCWIHKAESIFILELTRVEPHYLIVLTAS